MIWWKSQVFNFNQPYNKILIFVFKFYWKVLVCILFDQNCPDILYIDSVLYVNLLKQWKPLDVY